MLGAASALQECRRFENAKAGCNWTGVRPERARPDLGAFPRLDVKVPVSPLRTRTGTRKRIERFAPGRRGRPARPHSVRKPGPTESRELEVGCGNERKAVTNAMTDEGTCGLAPPIECVLNASQAARR